MAILTYYLGCMYAGKSSSAVHQLIHSPHHHKIIISPNAHKRGFVSRLHSLEDLSQNIQLYAHVKQLPKQLLNPNQSCLIFIDEVQFIDDELFWQLLDHAKHAHHLDLILAGISYDQHAKTFANHQKLMHYCLESIKELYVPCATCSCSQGQVSIRKWRTSDRITDDYAVLCLSCFDRFFHSQAAASKHCAICQNPNANHQLRHWKSEHAQQDSQCPLCPSCYEHILSYGNDYATNDASLKEAKEPL